MKTKQQIESPALHLIRHMAEHEGHGRGRSREKRNEAIQWAIRAAIDYGLRFDLEDFKTLAVNPHGYRGSALIDACGQSIEFYYALACGSERNSENRSAAQAFEHWMGRKPFLIRPRPDAKTPTRVYVGLEFNWYGYKVKCTSFADDQASFVACLYRVPPADQQYHAKKVHRRFTITRSDIADWHAAIGSWNDLYAKIKQLEKNEYARLEQEFSEAFGDDLRRRYGLAAKQLAAAHAKIDNVLSASMTRVVPA